MRNLWSIYAKLAWAHAENKDGEHNCTSTACLSTKVQRKRQDFLFLEPLTFDLSDFCSLSSFWVCGDLRRYLKTPTRVWIISPSSLSSLCAKLHWKMDFLASDAVRSQQWKTLCTATPAMRVILKGWGRIYERWGGSLVLSPLPVMVQRSLHLTITLMLWIPLLPFLIFASSSSPSASLSYIPSALCPPWCRCVIMGSSSNLAEHLHFWQNYYLHFQYIFIFITVIACW